MAIPPHPRPEDHPTIATSHSTYVDKLLMIVDGYYIDSEDYKALYALLSAIDNGTYDRVVYEGDSWDADYTYGS